MTPKARGLKRPPVRADSKAIVEAILGATVELAEEGIADLSVHRIAERAGVGVASIYRYFGGMEAIFAELARRRNDALLCAFDAVLARGESVEETLRALVVGLARMGPRDEALRRAINLDLPLRGVVDAIDQVNESVITRLCAWLRERLVAPPEDLEVRAFVAFGAVRGVVRLRLIVGARAPHQEALIERLTALVIEELTAK